MTSDPTYRDLLYFLYTTVFAVMASLAPFYWRCFISSLLTFGLTRFALHLAYNAATAWDHLLSACTVDSIMGSILSFCRVAPCRSRQRKTRKQRGSSAGFARGWTCKSRRAPENICAACRCTLWENKTSKQGKHICTFVCVFVSDFCTPV